MRTIKFRAWHKKKKIMKQLTLLGLMWENCNDPPIYSDFGETSYEEDVPHYSDVELMQYTGLKDKNGKEIYEGDIVKSTRCVHYSIAECYFEDGSFQFKGTGCGSCDEYLSNNVLGDFEIIGNIHENKD